MSTDYKALCAELADALAEWQLGGGPPEDTADADLINRARAALAQPEPEPVVLTDEDLYDLAEVFNGEPVPAIRRALELWGTPANTINQED